jgi:transposase-like protein
MINWELPHEKIACPHCGSTETQMTLQLLGLIRYSCNGCRKSFATHGDRAGKTRQQAKAVSADPTPRGA